MDPPPSPLLDHHVDNTKGKDLPLKTACYPFDNRHSDADVVLRTPDGTLFYVHKAVLRIASLFFSQMFSLPQPHSSTQTSACEDHSPPIIPVSEDPQTIEQLLRMCYPVDRPARRGEARTLRSTLGAALKYDMPLVTTLLTQSLRSHLHDRPLYVFAVAHQLGLEGMSKEAVHSYTAWTTTWSKHTHSGKATATKHSRNSPLDEYSSEMDNLSTAVYYRLLEHHTSVTPSTTPSHTEAAVTLITTYPHQLTQPREITGEVTISPLPHSFQDPSHGDIIIRSCDSIDFHVDRRLLEFASPQFAHVLSAPASTAPSSNPSETPSSKAQVQSEPPRYHLPENGRTLENLFQLCYPMPDPSSGGKEPEWDDGLLKRGLSLYDAAVKYGVERAKSFAKQICVSAAKANPVQLYLLATHYHWDDTAKYAALLAVYATSDTYLAEMEFVPAAAYRRLLLYRRKCRDVILSGGKYAPDEGAATEPRVPLRRADYWSKSAWLARPGEARFWLAFHQRIGSSGAAGELDGYFPTDMEAFLPTSLMDSTERAAPSSSNDDSASCGTPTISSDSRHVQLKEIARQLVRVGRRCFSCPDPFR